MIDEEVTLWVNCVETDTWHVVKMERAEWAVTSVCSTSMSTILKLNGVGT